MSAQGALLLLLHLPRKTFVASAPQLARLVEAARAPGASESTRILGAVLRTFVSDGLLRPLDVDQSMGTDGFELRAALLAEAERAELRLPSAYAYATVPPDVRGEPPEARAPSLSEACAGEALSPDAAARAARDGTPHGLFAVRADYVDPLLRHRSAAPSRPLANVDGGGPGSIIPPPPPRAPVAATAAAAPSRPSAATAAIKAAAARKAAAEAAGPKKRTIMFVEDGAAVAQVAQRDAAGAKQRKR